MKENSHGERRTDKDIKSNVNVCKLPRPPDLILWPNMGHRSLRF